MSEPLHHPAGPSAQNDFALKHPANVDDNGIESLQIECGNAVSRRSVLRRIDMWLLPMVGAQPYSVWNTFIFTNLHRCS